MHPAFASISLLVVAACSASSPRPRSVAASPTPAAERSSDASSPHARAANEPASDSAGEPVPTPLTDDDRRRFRRACSARMSPPDPVTSFQGKPVPTGVPSSFGLSDEAESDCDGDRWETIQADHPTEESVYCMIVAQADLCGKPTEAIDWARRRTEVFPESADAWFYLGVENFRRLFPRAGSRQPYNDALPAERRRDLATAALEAFDKAATLDPENTIPLTWAAMAHAQRRLSYTVVERPKTVQQRLDAIDARAEEMAAWRRRKAICDLQGLRTTCRADTPATTPCCPPPPYKESRIARDAEQRAALQSTK